MNDLFDDLDRAPRLADLDPCRNRHGGNPASEAAFAKAAMGRRERWVSILRWLKAKGKGTSKMYAAEFNVQLNVISPRWSELSKASPRTWSEPLIRETGEYVEDARVMELTAAGKKWLVENA